MIINILCSKKYSQKKMECQIIPISIYSQNGFNFNQITNSSISINMPSCPYKIGIDISKSPQSGEAIMIKIDHSNPQTYLEIASNNQWVPLYPLFELESLFLSVALEEKKYEITHFEPVCRSDSKKECKRIKKYNSKKLYKKERIKNRKLKYHDINYHNYECQCDICLRDLDFEIHSRIEDRRREYIQHRLKDYLGYNMGIYYY